MIYFIQDTVTCAIKIGYSTNPRKRLKNLQNSNQNKLELLYAMHGELEHEAELLQRFDKFKMEGEWFKGEIAGEVWQIIAADKLNPRQPSLTVLVAGDVEYHGQGLVPQALSEIHARTPIFCVVVSGERALDRAASAWASQQGEGLPLLPQLAKAWAGWRCCCRPQNAQGTIRPQAVARVSAG